MITPSQGTRRTSTLWAYVLVFTVPWILLALDPVDRTTWLLENVLVFLSLAVLIATSTKFAFSSIAYASLFAFLLLHSIGAHFTYSLTPYDQWFDFSINEQLGWERNHFDRFVHFSYGLLVFVPLRELCIRLIGLGGIWAYFIPLDLVMSSSLAYELLEWGAAIVFGGELGMTFLGTQGDQWDAHKDMALAGLGGLTTLLIFAFASRRSAME